MDFDEEFDDEFDEQEFDEDLEDLDEDLDEEFDNEGEEPVVKTPEEVVETKVPTAQSVREGKKISVFFMSTIGPGEKKQKLTVNDGYLVGDIKETVANLFGLDPADFYLSSGGVTMDETYPLSYYNVSDGDDILLIPASVAG
ncbi:MAG: ubiquitin-like domain-containing protein [Candidatus Lokiarchaeia archaeon]|nr:ubiquitin-like domain-containing protein [Candidatus Lokiarchaeia archaeon]